jgi:steroid delta-isomerase-like uncharacterized protein
MCRSSDLSHAELQRLYPGCRVYLSEGYEIRRSSPKGMAAMSVEENKAIARRVYEIICTGDFERAEEIVDRNAPDNEAIPNMDPDTKLIDTFKETFSEAREAFPDMQVTVEDLIAEGERVAARVTMRGTYRGEFQGITPTGKRVEVSAIDVFRIANSKIVEHWGHSDDPAGVLHPADCP